MFPLPVKYDPWMTWWLLRTILQILYCFSRKSKNLGDI
jgi:hypothetical protein